ncbi:hypothetical protein ABS71_06390 [bacterium SCN 62-11]|nr:hypothetical protein [Candidatus Eremiobacteraeota bacterium]ODT73877.1 MAG: hypothetical protein ABS71_06390 [bacterium SCN 62-11]
MSLLILLMGTAAVWEFVLWRSSARLCGPALPAQWGAQFLVRSLLGLLAWGAFQTQAVAYAAVSVFHGQWAGWPLTLFVFSAFLAIISGAVFAALTPLFALLWWLKPGRGQS